MKGLTYVLVVVSLAGTSTGGFLVLGLSISFCHSLYSSSVWSAGSGWPARNCLGGSFGGGGLAVVVPAALEVGGEGAGRVGIGGTSTRNCDISEDAAWSDEEADDCDAPVPRDTGADDRSTIIGAAPLDAADDVGACPPEPTAP